MNVMQKAICVLIAGLIVVSCIFAPYQFRVHDEIARLINRDARGTPVNGLTYAPIWSPPSLSDGMVGPEWARRVAGSGVAVDDVRLSTSRLLLEWILILIVGGGLLIFAGRSMASESLTDRRAERSERRASFH